jgi:hypothetical protein
MSLARLVLPQFLQRPVTRSLQTGTTSHHCRRLLTTRATFHYLEDRPEYRTVKPYHINIPERAFAPGLQSNEVSIPYHNIPVTGLRGIHENFTLDRNGFKVVVEDATRDKTLCNVMQYDEYADEALVRGKARKGVEHFLQKHIPGCEDAVAFSHQVNSATSLRRICSWL